MKAKKSKIKFKGKVQNPRAKKFRIVKIGSKINRPKSRNMHGILKKSSVKDLKENILKTNSKRKKIITAVKLNTKKIENLILSVSGIETLSENSFRQIQTKRLESSREIIRLVSDLSVSTRKLTSLEKKYKKLLGT